MHTTKKENPEAIKTVQLLRMMKTQTNIEYRNMLIDKFSFHSNVN